MYRYILENRGFKRVAVLTVLSSLILSAEIDLQKGMYDAADEMMRYDEKMNRAIAEHNQISSERDREMRLNDNSIEDFEEIEGGYLLKQDIAQDAKTKIDVTLSDGMIIISTTTVKEERSVSQTERLEKVIEKTSTTSLSLPHDADENSMQKSYTNGTLEIKFSKK